MNETIYEAGNAALPEGFLALPPLVYADEPMWIPESPEAVAAAFSDANLWYTDGESAAFCIPQKARLATFVSPHIAIDGVPSAYFGYWETVGDKAADDAIFARAEQWAKERGAQALYGPINFSTFGTYRIRRSAEPDAYPFVGEPFNPDYYESIVDRLGFSRFSEALTQIATVELGGMLVEMRRPLMEKLRREGVEITGLDHTTWLERIEEFHEVIDVSFADNWGYTPIEFDAFRQACGEKFIRKTDPNTSTVAYDPQGRVIGFFLVYPQWGPILVQQAGSERVSLDELDYDTHWPQLRAMGKPMGVAKTGATLPEWRGQGIFSALGTALTERSLDVYSHAVNPLIAPDRHSRRFVRGLALDARWYSVYGKSLS